MHWRGDFYYISIIILEMYINPYPVKRQVPFTEFNWEPQLKAKQTIYK
jgi:hypothetical protein